MCGSDRPQQQAATFTGENVAAGVLKTGYLVAVGLRESRKSRASRGTTTLLTRWSKANTTLNMNAHLPLVKCGAARYLTRCFPGLLFYRRRYCVSIRSPSTITGETEKGALQMTNDNRRITTLPFRERRSTPRCPLNTVQQLAEIVDGSMPSPDAFERVQCIDISRSGFAFYTRMVPESGEFVIALGDAPDFVYLTASIVQSKMVDRWGQKFYRIGCQFTGRAELTGHSLSRKPRQDNEGTFLLMPGDLTGDEYAYLWSS